MAIMTQNNSTAKVRHDGDNCTTQVGLFRPRFHRTHRGKLSSPEGKKKHVTKEVAIIFVCVIDIWRMVWRRRGKYSAVCTNKTVCTDL